jgi:cellulose synthase/poly-beta-1,6-N-acetylglucosamine synthase-like glycosyltransferase
MSRAELTFWASSLLLVYALMGYSLLIRAWAMLRPRGVRREPIEPTVSVVIVAQDEEARIDARLTNLLALDYPRDRLELILASDGSSDATVDRARAYERAGVQVVSFEARRGKPSVLNNVIPRCRGDIVVLGDARQRFDKGVLRALVAPFADPTVGVVSGELVLTGEEGAVSSGVGFYWRLEKTIRASEARIDSAVGATGAIYALRRDLFERIPADTILDDVLIPLRIARRGYRVLFETAARAYDRASSIAEQEMTRKVRTIAGNFQLFAREQWLLNPFRNRLWLQTVSHKTLRLFIPVLLSIILAANLFLLSDPKFAALLLAQVAFYGGAFASQFVRSWPRVARVLGIAYMVCLLAWATSLAFCRFLGGSQTVTWTKARARETR